MTSSLKSRRGCLSAKVCALTLGLAVFLWGTQYKLSLYFVPSESHPMVPTAKLLGPETSPQRSTNAGSTRVKARSTPKPHNFSFALCANAFAFVQLIRHADQTAQYVSPAQNASFTHFAARPPPASIYPTSSI
jgi:hypothetical protein